MQQVKCFLKIEFYWLISVSWKYSVELNFYKNCSKLNLMNVGDIVAIRFIFLLSIFVIFYISFGIDANAQTEAEDVYELELACEAGDLVKCVLAGNEYRLGDIVERNFEHSFGLYEKACMRGLPRGCAVLGKVYIAGEGVARDLGTGVFLLRSACHFGSYRACKNYVSYAPEDQELRLVRKFFYLASSKCDQDDPYACWMVAKFSLDPLSQRYDVGVTAEKAVKIVREGCKKNEGMHCELLAGIHYDGRGVDESKHLAFEFYERACQLDRVSACMTIAWFFVLGEAENEIQLDKGIRLLEQYCIEKGDACNSLAHLYYEEKYGVRDKAKAIEFWEKGCELENRISCSMLVSLLYFGDLEFQDQVRAFQLAESLCNQAPYYCVVLGEIYIQKSYAKFDVEKAFLNFKKACRHFSGHACRRQAEFYENGRWRKVEARISDIEKELYIASKNCSEIGSSVYCRRMIGIVMDLNRYYHQKACDLAVAQSCIKANGLRNGSEKALKNLHKACAAGLDQACLKLKELNKSK